MKSTKNNWKLQRLGSQSSPDFELQQDIPIIRAGRSRNCRIQFRGLAALSISRCHLEFHFRRFWHIKDPGSANGNFLNGGRIPQKKLIRLCAGDILGVGGNFTEEEVSKKKVSKPYLFRIVAPNKRLDENFKNYLSFVQRDKKYGYKCKYSRCKFSSNKSKFQALLHIIKKHQTCPECDEDLKDIDTIEHMENAHGWKLSCDFCQYKNLNKYTVWKHIRTKHASAKMPKIPKNCYQCEFSKCPYKTKHREDWQLHMIGKHKKCPECKSRLKSLDPLNHMAQAHGWTVNRCEFCPYKTLRRHNLNDHIKRQHIKKESKTKQTTRKVPIYLRILGPKWQLCNHCPYRTIYKHSLIYHMNSRHSDKKRKRIEDLYNPERIHQRPGLLTRKLIVLVIRNSELDSLAIKIMPKNM